VTATPTDDELEETTLRGDIPSHRREHWEYMEALKRMENYASMPPVVTGVARYVVSAEPDEGACNQRDVLATLPLVTNDFWRAVRRVFDNFDWSVRVPEDVNPESPGFIIQWRLLSGLFGYLGSAGADGSKRTDKDRRDAADAIVIASKKLRRALDAATGFDAAGDWLGLDTLFAEELIRQAGTVRTGERFCVVPVTQPRFSPVNEADQRQHAQYIRESRMLRGLTVQELLLQGEQQIERQAANISVDSFGQPRQARFVILLQNWLGLVQFYSRQDKPEGFYRPCVRTADVILEARHPEVPRVAHPARSRSKS